MKNFFLLLIASLFWFYSFSQDKQNVYLSANSICKNAQLTVSVSVLMGEYQVISVWNPANQNVYDIAESALVGGSYTFPANFFSMVGTWKFQYYSNSVLTTKNLLVEGNSTNSIAANEIICGGGGTPANITNSALNANAAYTISWQSRLVSGGWGTIGGANLASFQPSYINQSTVYRRIVTTSTALACVDYSNEITKTVYTALNAGSIQSNQTICYGSTPSVLAEYISASGASGSYSYQWQISSNGTDFSDISGAVGSSYQPSFIIGTSYYRRKVVDAVCDPAYTNSIYVICYADVTAASISSDQAICYNSQPATIGITVNPSGGDGTFTNQWQVSTDGTNFSNIPSATGNSYLPPVLTSSTWYRVVSTTSCKTVTSNSIKINVYNPLTSGTIGNAQTICHNTAPSALSFTVNPSGSDGSYSYQWQESSNSVDFSDINAQNGTSYQPNALTADSWYRVKVSSTCGTVFTNIVKISIYSPLSLPTIKETKNICYNTSGGTLYLDGSPSGSNSSYSYQWEYSTDNVNFFNVSGATSTTLEVGTLLSSRWYKLKVVSGCETKYTNTVKVNVYTALTSGTIGNAQTICHNTAPSALSFTVNPSGSDGSYSYQWQESSNSVDFSDINAQNGTSYQPNALTADSWYRVKVSSTCGTVFTNIVKITVYPAFTSGTIGNAQTICHNTAPSALSFTVNPSGSDGSYSYQWQESSNSVDFSDINAQNGTSYQPNALTADSWYRVKVSSTCGTVFTNIVKISVYQPFTSGTIGNAQTICHNTAPSALSFTVNPSGSDGSYSYQWQESSNSVDFSDINAQNGTSYQPNALTADSWYRVKVSSTCGTVFTNIVKITVKLPLSVGVISENQTICFGSIPSKLYFSTPTSNGKGIFSYQWFSSVNDGTTWSQISGANTAEYQSGALTAKTLFKVVVSDDCNSLESNIVTVNLYGNLLSGSISANQTVCFGSTPSKVELTTNPSGGFGVYSYNWYVSDNGTNFNPIPFEFEVSYNPPALTSSKYYLLKVTDSKCGSVNTNIVKVNVLADLSSGQVGYSQNICFGSTPNQLVGTQAPSGGNGLYSFQWEELIGTDWKSVDGATLETFQPLALTSTKYYRRKVSAEACGDKVSNVVSITVKPEFLAGTIGNNQVISYGQLPEILNTIASTSGGAGSYSFQWQYSQNNDTYVNINGETKESYQSPALTSTRYFRRKATDSQCGEKFSNVVKVEVAQSLNGGTISENQTICFDTKPNKIVGTPATGGTSNFIYSWKKSSNNIEYFDIVGASEVDYQPLNMRESTYFKRIATSNGQSVESNKVFIEVRPAISEVSVDLKNRYCKDSDVSISVLNVESGMKYNWYSKNLVFIKEGSSFSISNFSKDSSLMVNKVNSLGCASVFKAIDVRIDEVKADFSADRNTIKQGENIAFANTSVNGSSFTWDFGDGVTSQETSPIHYYHKLVNMAITSFDVSLLTTSPNGCTSLLVKPSFITVSPITSDIPDLVSSTIVKPSIFSSDISFISDFNISRILIFSITGELKGSFLVNSNSTTLNLSHLVNGVYMAKVEFGNSFFVTKIVKIQ
jgi:hypothetical protein